MYTEASGFRKLILFYGNFMRECILLNTVACLHSTQLTIINIFDKNIEAVSFGINVPKDNNRFLGRDLTLFKLGTVRVRFKQTLPCYNGECCTNQIRSLCEITLFSYYILIQIGTLSNFFLVHNFLFLYISKHISSMC